LLAYPKLAACGLGDTFTAATTSSAAEFFDLHTDEELEEARRLAEPEFEEDFNEYISRPSLPSEHQ